MNLKWELGATNEPAKKGSEYRELREDGLACAKIQVSTAWAGVKYCKKHTVNPWISERLISGPPRIPKSSDAQVLYIKLCIQSEVSQMEKNKYCNNAYMWNLEKWQRWTYLQSRNRDTDIKNKCIDTKRGWGWEGNTGFGDWDWHIHTSMYKVDN